MKTITELLTEVPDSTVIRQFAIRAEEFEHFRACRKYYSQRLNMNLSNSQTLTLILADHSASNQIGSKGTRDDQ